MLRFLIFFVFAFGLLLAFAIMRLYDYEAASNFCLVGGLLCVALSCSSLTSLSVDNHEAAVTQYESAVNEGYATIYNGQKVEELDNNVLNRIESFDVMYDNSGKQVVITTR